MLFWLMAGLVSTSGPASAEPPAPNTDLEAQLTTLRARLDECESAVRKLQDRVDGLRRSAAEGSAEGLADLKKASADHKDHCRSLGSSLESFRRSERETANFTGRKLRELERRLLVLGQAERKLDGGLQMVEVLQKRRAETERRRVEAEQRRLQGDQKRKQDESSNLSRP
jgi:chromosome segregation ATPase